MTDVTNVANNPKTSIGSSQPGEEASDGDIHLKKGPWAPEEDKILDEYVRKHGEGNWNAVQKRTGLARCGKSCRLRWTNHLRPDLIKTAFKPEEERKIIEMHARMGNKWAQMAVEKYHYQAKSGTGILFDMEQKLYNP
ncbi:Transcription factor MYB101-like protein [Drosera capensis]